MIHAIYIYCIVNAFMLGYFEEDWNESRNRLINKIVIFLLITLLGAPMWIIGFIVDAFNYFKAGDGRSIIVNLKFILFTKSATTKLLDKIIAKDEWLKETKRISEIKEDMKGKSLNDKLHILAIKKVMQHIEKNNLIKTK